MPTYEHIKIADDNSFPGRGGTALDARYLRNGGTATFTSSAIGSGTLDVAHTLRVDALSGRTGIFVRNEQAKYALKIDQYDTNGPHDAVNIAANFGGAHTPLGIVSGNTEFSTVKVTNTAIQTGGQIFAAVGSNPERTAGLFGGDNWGKGPSFLSSMKAGSEAVAFRASYDAGTYTTPIMWANGHHTGGHLLYIENDSAHTSGSMLRLVETNASTNTPIISIANTGTGDTIQAPGITVTKDGRVKIGQIENSTSFNNGTVQMTATGTQVTRSVNDANPIFRVRDQSTASTGDLTQFQDRSGTVVARVTQTGDVEITSATSGVIMKSPNGTKFRLTISNTGAIIATSI